VRGPPHFSDSASLGVVEATGNELAHRRYFSPLREVWLLMKAEASL